MLMMNHTVFRPASVHLASKSHQLVTVVGSDPYLIEAHIYMHICACVQYVYRYTVCTVYVHVCVLVYMHAIIRVVGCYTNR